MRRTLSDNDLNDYGAKLGTAVRIAALLLAGLATVLLASPADAQTVPSVTFGTSVTNADGTLTTVNTWSTTPAAASCTASTTGWTGTGAAPWTGTKAASGTQALPAITMSGSYTLTLACAWPGDTQVIVNWTTPTTNTDGTAIAKCATPTTTGPCLSEFRVYRRLGSPNLDGGEMTPVHDPNANSRTFTGLPAGTHYFGVEAANGDGKPSPMSNIVSKTITAAVTKTASVTITVNPVPGAPVVSLQ